MPEEEPIDGRSEAGPGSRADDPVRSTLVGLMATPARALAVLAAAALVLLYSVFIQQELLLAVWLGLVGFVVYLVWRFVRAHERLAAAAERIADD